MANLTNTNRVMSSAGALLFCEQTSSNSGGHAKNYDWQACKSNLVEGVQTCRQVEVHPQANRGFIYAHSKGGSGHHYWSATGHPAFVNIGPFLASQPRVIRLTADTCTRVYTVNVCTVRGPKADLGYPWNRRQRQRAVDGDLAPPVQQL